eukprot:350436-Chlamydomonas_euryale.AAC.4
MLTSASSPRLSATPASPPSLVCERRAATRGDGTRGTKNPTSSTTRAAAPAHAGSGRGRSANNPAGRWFQRI